MRPGILRPHARSASSGQPQYQPQGDAPSPSPSRALRFDSSSTVPSVGAKRSGLNLDVAAASSADKESSSPRELWSSASQQRLREPEIVEHTHNRHATVMDRDEDEDEDDVDEDDRDREEDEDEFDEDGYGELISPRLGLGLGLVEGSAKSRLHELRRLERRPSSGSPLPSPTVAQDPDAARYAFDCPFSINRPPPEPLAPDAPASVPSALSADSGGRWWIGRRASGGRERGCTAAAYGGGWRRQTVVDDDRGMYYSLRCTYSTRHYEWIFLTHTPNALRRLKSLIHVRLKCLILKTRPS